LLVAYYCPEPASAAVQRWFRRLRAPAVSDLTELEALSAIARKVRDRTMSRQDGHKVAATFLSHLEGGFYTRAALGREQYRLARDWIGRFEIPLSTFDALHLAVSYLAGLPLATADRGLARHARAVGVQVLRIP
jgi:predicted nucleic acid-binding protein